jgi:GAF domain-containing protein
MIDDEPVRDLAIHRSGILHLNRDAEFASIVAFAAAKYHAPIAALTIISGGRQLILATSGAELYETDRSDSICATTIQSPGEPLIVPDASNDIRFSALSPVIKAPFIRFYAGMSIVDQNGYPLGAICICDDKARSGAFDPTDLRLRAREIERLLR